ncbi:MAG: hypothetical protein NTX00_00105 [Candidatus Parcubacteria bacterium]|nr:hypothetical protein [Candidatus Parcubacteria bacterium]
MEKIPEQFKHEVKKWKSPDEVLSLSPKQLQEYFIELETKGELEKFLDQAAENDALVAQFSYWEKWFDKEQRKLVDQIIEKKKKIYPGEKEGLPLNLEKKFTEEELEIIFSNLGSIQLTFGCSKGCPFCGFDAVPGVREAIPYPQLANLFKNYGRLLGERTPFLYWASEPSDYKIDDKTYEDVQELAETYAGYQPFISSRETRNQSWIQYLDTKGKSRISAFGIQDPKIFNLQSLNIEVAGLGKEHFKGLGVSSLTNKIDDMKDRVGIGCYNGLLLTPRGLYNIYQVYISEKFPQGQMVVPFNGFEERKIKKGDSLSRVLHSNIIPYQEHNLGYENIEGNLFNSISILNKGYKKEIIIYNNKLKVLASLNFDDNEIDELKREEEKGYNKGKSTYSHSFVQDKLIEQINKKFKLQKKNLEIDLKDIKEKIKYNLEQNLDSKRLKELERGNLPILKIKKEKDIYYFYELNRCKIKSLSSVGITIPVVVFVEVNISDIPNEQKIKLKDMEKLSENDLRDILGGKNIKFKTRITKEDRKEFANYL